MAILIESGVLYFLFFVRDPLVCQQQSSDVRHS